MADCTLTHAEHFATWTSWRDDCTGPGECGFCVQDVDQCRRGHPDDGVTMCGACGHGADTGYAQRRAVSDHLGYRKERP